MPIASAARRTLPGPSGYPLEYELVEPAAPAALTVFVMGLGNHRTMWLLQREALASSCSMLFVDLRGMGSSAAPPGIWRVEHLADDILHVISSAAPHWSGQPIHLVGHSLGAHVGGEILQPAD